MSKLKKMLLIGIWIPLASCSTGAPKPQGPINVGMPVFIVDANGKTLVNSWRWNEMLEGNKKWSTSNAEARQVTPICVDADTYTRGREYQKELENYIDYLEKR